MEWKDDGTRAMWHCDVCGDKRDVVGLIPRKQYYGRFRFEKRGWDISYAFDDGWVQEIAQIRDPRCVECHRPATFHYVGCDLHKPYVYISSENHMTGKRYAMRRCEVCQMTLQSVEITEDDWKTFAEDLIVRGAHATS
ncbi:MAG TPA: hypothetical protein VI542_12305 [Candidatus Tectomicrobia bacterium]